MEGSPSRARHGDRGVELVEDRTDALVPTTGPGEVPARGEERLQAGRHSGYGRCMTAANGPLRIRAVAVAVRDDEVLVVLRERGGRSYAVLPGGGIEAGETPQVACVRELREETGLDGVVEALLPVGVDREAPAVYLRVRVTGGDPVLAPGSPESRRSTAENRYRPAWVRIDTIEDIGLVPEQAVRAVSAASRSTPRPPR